MKYILIAVLVLFAKVQASNVEKPSFDNLHVYLDQLMMKDFPAAMETLDKIELHMKKEEMTMRDYQHLAFMKAILFERMGADMAVQCYVKIIHTLNVYEAETLQHQEKSNKDKN